MMTVHRNAAMTDQKKPKKGYPVTTMKVHGWLLGYLGNPSVEWINGHTLIVWNSPAHRKMMAS